jgi:hypothetical protein
VARMGTPSPPVRATVASSAVEAKALRRLRRICPTQKIQTFWLGSGHLGAGPLFGLACRYFGPLLGWPVAYSGLSLRCSEQHVHCTTWRRDLCMAFAGKIHVP